eukprot:TRINITY_DN4292_c0_g1_i2.p1 TRINITY_DN4292_c0_g1~~TRINITY_DN4292_c0_g1_i2.p1  ORF type:complete len:160 (-),score=36.74 TRINITY_DN4292_c0_g1_i2:720-1199(-)
MRQARCSNPLLRLDSEDLTPSDLYRVKGWIQNSGRYASSIVGQRLRRFLTHSGDKIIRTEDGKDIFEEILLTDERESVFIFSSAIQLIWSPLESLLLESSHSVSLDSSGIVNEIHFEDESKQKLYLKGNFYLHFPHFLVIFLHFSPFFGRFSRFCVHFL